MNTTNQCSCERYTFKEEDDFCPRCGEERYDELQPVKPETIWQKVGFITIILLLLILMGSLFFAIFSTTQYGKKATMGLFHKSECGYKIPTPYSMLSDGKDYIVKRIDENGEAFLDAGSSKIYFWTESYINEYPPTRFADSCLAKGVLKEYLEQGTLTNFK